MNGDQRNYWYSKVVYKHDASYGPYCRGCGKHVWKETDDESIKPKGILDHIDANPENTVLHNLQLLCRSCNRIKNPKRYQPEPVKTFSEKQNEKEDEWRQWILNKCAFEPNGYPTEEAIDTGAELIKISPETIERRWMRKITSSAGPLLEEKGKLYLKKYIEQKKEQARQLMLEHRT